MAEVITPYSRPLTLQKLNRISPSEPGSDDLDPDTIIDRARSLELGIRQDPERYGIVLETLGDVATSGRERSLAQLDLGEAESAIATTIFEYFAGSCDRGVVYDTDTEDAVFANSELQAALKVHNNLKRKTYTMGIMSHEDRPNQNSTPAKNASRRRIKLKLYITAEPSLGSNNKIRKQTSKLT